MRMLAVMRAQDAKRKEDSKLFKMKQAMNLSGKRSSTLQELQRSQSKQDREVTKLKAQYDKAKRDVLISQAFLPNVARNLNNIRVDTSRGTKLKLPVHTSCGQRKSKLIVHETPYHNHPSEKASTVEMNTPA